LFLPPDTWHKIFRYHPVPLIRESAAAVTGGFHTTLAVTGTVSSARQSNAPPARGPVCGTAHPVFPLELAGQSSRHSLVRFNYDHSVVHAFTGEDVRARVKVELRLSVRRIA
jgi:hypothetical protein